MTGNVNISEQPNTIGFSEIKRKWRFSDGSEFEFPIDAQIWREHYETVEIPAAFGAHGKVLVSVDSLPGDPPAEDAPSTIVNKIDAFRDEFLAAASPPEKLEAAIRFAVTAEEIIVAGNLNTTAAGVHSAIQMFAPERYSVWLEGTKLRNDPTRTAAYALDNSLSAYYTAAILQVPESRLKQILNAIGTPACVDYAATI